MAKQPNSRKKSVMQDVHPDVVDRIEEWTDPEAIEHARKRIVDYAKVAEKFATADLPEEDEDLDLNAALPIQPEVPEIASVSESEDEDLLNSLELDDIGEEDTFRGVQDADTAADLNMDDFDDFNDLEDHLSSDETPEPVRHSALDDFDDIDTDLLADLDQDENNNHALGDEAFGPDTGESSDEDSFMDDDIFGIPSASQEPTPYGNRSAKENSRGSKEIEPDDDLESLFGNLDAAKTDRESDDFDAFLSNQATGQKVPAWMYDDDATPSVLSPSRRAADQDEDESKVFGDASDNPSSLDSAEETERQARHVEPSSDALNEMLGLRQEASLAVDEKPEADVNVLPVEVSEKPKKKGLFGFLGKKTKKVDIQNETDIVTGAETETVTETISEETPEGEVVLEENVSTTTVKKKKSKKTAVTLLAIALLGGGAYVAADQMGYLSGAEPVVVPKTQVKTAPLFPAFDETQTDSGNAKVDPAVVPGANVEDTKTVPSDTAPSETVDDVKPAIIDVPQDKPAESSDMGSAPGVTEPVIPDDSDNASVAPDAKEDQAQDPLDSSKEPSTEKETSSADPSKADPGAETAGPQIPEKTVDALGDLYGVGVSETQVAEADAAKMATSIAELTTVLKDQKAALDSALNRVKTLEAVMAERDSTLATTQDEAETARQAAQEAKDMALAQNKVLIEVVGMRDKMQIAEDLIVELSQRTHSLESDDSETQQIRQLNDRITELTRDVGLLARTVLTSGQNLADQKAAQAAADRAHDQAQAAVDAEAESTINRQTKSAPAGSGAVYGNEKKLLTLPEETEIPDTVKVGDKIPGYGEVLDISEMADGSRLVVMENNSKVLPKK